MEKTKKIAITAKAATADEMEGIINDIKAQGGTPIEEHELVTSFMDIFVQATKSMPDERIILDIKTILAFNDHPNKDTIIRLLQKYEDKLYAIADDAWHAIHDLYQIHRDFEDIQMDDEKSIDRIVKENATEIATILAIHEVLKKELPETQKRITKLVEHACPDLIEKAHTDMKNDKPCKEKTSLDKEIASLENELAVSTMIRKLETSIEKFEKETKEEK